MFGLGSSPPRDMAHLVVKGCSVYCHCWIHGDEIESNMMHCTLPKDKRKACKKAGSVDSGGDLHSFSWCWLVVSPPNRSVGELQGEV